MSHHKDGHHDDVEHAESGEREGFLDKVKDFFTGGDEHGREAAPQEELAPEQDDLAEGQGETDSVASAGTGGLGESESGWDGSDEPPELSVPQNEAVAAHSEDSGDEAGDEAGDEPSNEPSDEPMSAAAGEAAGEAADAADDEAYESRHGSGVDDSGVLADAPPEDDDGDDDDGDGDEAGAAREEEERARREEEFAREHDPATHDLEAGEEFRQRGDWTAAEHDGPQVQEADGTGHDPDADASGGSASDAEEGETSRQDAGDSDVAEMTGAEGIEDGGHGWGSAAPMPGGKTPLGHPVKAWHDTMTFVLPGEDGYEGSDPHEWFVDAEAAQRAGFRHAHSG